MILRIQKLQRKLLEDDQIEFVEYHVRRLEEDCCVDLPTTRAPALFAPEGQFEGIKEYLTIEKTNSTSESSESAYW